MSSKYLPGSVPLYGAEIGCTHGVERGKQCRRCAREDERVRRLIAAQKEARKRSAS